MAEPFAARRLLAAVAVAAFTSACSSEPAEKLATVALEARCTIDNVERYDDLRSCLGNPVQIELVVAKSIDGKTTSKIAVASKDPDAILAAIGAWAVEWSVGADSFTVFAYGSEADADAGGYNRGRMYWNDGGPIQLDICTEFSDVGGVDFCEAQMTRTLENR